MLEHYQPDKPETLAADASLCGLGTVISHQMNDGSDRPIAYISRTLTATKQNYSQLEKEGENGVMSGYLSCTSSCLLHSHRCRINSLWKCAFKKRLVSGQRNKMCQIIKQWCFVLLVILHIYRRRWRPGIIRGKKVRESE